ncbi:MAG: SatD family protein [Sphaerochaetaceae bacterium]|jgi:hypothetical protein
MEQENKYYVVIIGDIVGSWKITNRNGIQCTLKKVLGKINEAYDKDIASNFMLTLGDEFQGVLVNGAVALPIIGQIEQEMLPTKIRFGLGIGRIVTAIDKNLPLGSDGPAYRNAKDMVDAIKGLEKKREKAIPSLLIKSEEDFASYDALMNNILLCCKVLKERWNSHQRKVIACFEEQGSQQAAAVQLGINQSSVSKSLSSSNYYLYRESLGNVSLRLEKIVDGLG